MLNELRDYHLPPPVSWWPLAPGWWIIIILSLLMITLGFTRWLHYRRYTAAARRAQSGLIALRKILHQQGDVRLVLRSTSQLLRRFALTRFDKSQVAGLVSTEWLKFLDDHGGNGNFQSDLGKLLIDTSYRAPNFIADKDGLDSQALELLELVANWIKYNQNQHK
ncbi:hypothetical protein TI04_06855 [Achromatium sp. WMS2]|nr:hypothetical protein TI04_06855 [Achromatium sp. WMS2]